MRFTFSEDLVPDSLVNIWIDEELIKLKPHVDGKCMWIRKNEMIFQPSGKFKPSTDYTCEFTRKLLKINPQFSYKGDKKFKFHTPYLEVDDVMTYWSLDKKTSKPVMLCDLQFNYPVQPKEVASLLNIEVDKESQDFSLMTRSKSQTITLKIPGLKIEDRDYSTKVTLDKGLTAVGGDIKTSKPFVIEYDLASPLRLIIHSMESFHDGDEGMLTVYTSQTVNEEGIKNFIKISPWVRYEVDVAPNHFVIHSESFNVNNAYTITIKEGLNGILGGKLKESYSQPVSFGQVEPTIKFVDQKEFYVSGKGSKNIAVAIYNVPSVSVVITKIYENNITGFIRNFSFGSDYSNEYYDDYYDEYYYDYYYDRATPSDYGDVVYQKSIDPKTLPKQGAYRILNLDFDDKLSAYKGIYHIQVKSNDNYWLKAEKVLSISDIGIIVKKGKDHIKVFTNSVKTAQPISNASVSFIGRNNQVINTATTGPDGVASYDVGKLPASGFLINMITIRNGEDFNFIPLNKTQVSTSRFDVGGKRQNEAAMEAYLYGERELYRPGEEVNISAIVRDKTWQNPGQIPVIVKINSPQGKNFKTIKKLLDKEGSFETSFNLPSTALTGTYAVKLYTSNNVLLASDVIKVEEFMPDRIKIDIKLNKKEYKPEDNVKLSISAENFFGPPAAGRNYEVEYSTRRDYFYSSEHNDYNYYIEGFDAYFDKEYADGETDEEGKATEYFSASSLSNIGCLNSDIYVTVFDETGRPVHRRTSFKTYTQDVFYGTKYNGYYAQTGKPVKIGLIAVDKKGKALSNQKAHVVLIKYEYKTVLSKSGSYFRYRSETVEKVLKDQEILLNGTSKNFYFTPETSGQYELRVFEPEADTYVKESVYAYGWGSTSFSSFKVNNEGQIDIQLDKKEYQVGEKANVILKAPFSGKILVTVESDKVLDYFYIETEKRAASFEIDLKEEYIPNMYITATLFRPHKNSDNPLTVAHGYCPVLIKDPSKELSVKIDASSTSRSNKKQKIQIKTLPEAEVTIAAVDEGILQITGYKSPDPFEYFFRKRALEVNSYDVYPYLIPELGMIRSHTGGGDMSEREKRLNPMQNNRVKLVSFWSGIKTADKNGNVEFNIDIPQFSGSLRIMAVAYKGDAFGAESKKMRVADPIVISAGLPRFLSPKDTFMIPVSVNNTTEKTAKCKVSVNTTGPLVLVGKSSQSVTIDKNREKQVTFKAYAKAELASGKVNITVNGLGETFKNTTEITVRPASPLQKRNGSGIITAGNSKNLKLSLNDFILSSVDKRLIVSNNPLVEFSNSLDYLVRYPYGCIEQTVSAAFPQIYFKDIMNTLYTGKQKPKDAIQNVQAALDRIQLMQLYSGGLTYWPGYGQETWWGSVYAAHFAIEAKKAGYQVDEKFLKSLLGYLKKKLKNKETRTYYYDTNKKKEIAPREIPYSLYVLALAGEKPVSIMNYYKAHPELLSLDSKYMLAAAYALTGDKKKFKEILPSSFRGEAANTMFGGSFASRVRDEAIALNVLLEVEPGNAQIPVMGKHVSSYLKERRYLNTQERSFGFLAMGKIAQQAAKSDVKAEIYVNGRKIGTMNNNSVSYAANQLKSGDIVVKTSGKGSVYYYWEIEGISSTGEYKEEDSYIKVRRSYYDRDGKKVYSKIFDQNELILVEIAIENGTQQYIENIAISDLLPAGFEIENPRLTELPSGLEFPNTRSYPTYMDIRDDRINFFINLPRYSSYRPVKYYYYLARAVSKGTFQLGPIGADAMYNGEYHSYHGAGTVRIK